MTKSVTTTVRLTPEVHEKLDALAQETKRSKSDLANEAITAYADRHAWQVSHIKAALAGGEAAGAGVPHEEVARWLASWGTSRELPRPEPKKS